MPIPRQFTFVVTSSDSLPSVRECFSRLVAELAIGSSCAQLVDCQSALTVLSHVTGELAAYVVQEEEDSSNE
jgi:hypothetical protein